MAMDMKSMIAAMAELPESQRKIMLGERLSMFAEMSEEDRQQAMRQMMEGMSGLPKDRMERLLKSRLEILAEMPEARRQALMTTHMKLLQQMPERARMEMQLIQSLKPQLLPPVQGMVENMMKMMPMPAMAEPTPARGKSSAPAPIAPTTSLYSRRAAPEPTYLARWGQTVTWIVALGGVWSVIWPFLFGYGSDGTIAVNNVIFGAGIAVLAAIVAGARQPASVGWVAALLWLVTLTGAWLVLSPFILGYRDQTAAAALTVLTGAGIGVLALIVVLARPEST
jgi:hypothetical protein